MAAAKLGLHVVEVDISLTDVQEIRTWLQLTQARTLYFNPVDENVNKLKQLRKSIPELFHCSLFSIPTVIESSDLFYFFFPFR